MIKRLAALGLAFVLLFQIILFTPSTTAELFQVQAQTEETEEEDLDEDDELEDEEDEDDEEFDFEDYDGEEFEDEDFDDGEMYEENERCARFEDVRLDDRLCRYLHNAYLNGVVSQNARFRLRAPITRAQFTALVYRGFELETDLSAGYFDDLPEGATFADQAATLRSLGIVSGVETDAGTRFLPKRPISRGAAAKILVGVIEYKNLHDFSEEAETFELETVFQDENLDSDTFAPFLRKLVRMELSDEFEPIMRGYSDGTIRSQRLISRIEAIVMIVRSMHISELINELTDPEILNDDFDSFIDGFDDFNDEMDEEDDEDEGEDEENYDIEFEIEMSNFEFSLNELEVEPGMVVGIELYSAEGTHNFVIDELDVESDTFEEGEGDFFTFEIPEDAEVGDTFEFYCSIGSHREQGMEGTIEVVEEI